MWRGANFVQKVGCRCGAVAILDRYVVLRCGEAPESCQQPERSDAVASRKASSSASSSSASSGSDSESEQKPLDVLRDSSSESDMEPAPASARGRCGLIVCVNFPVPLKSAELRTCFFQRRWARRLLVTQFVRNICHKPWNSATYNPTERYRLGAPSCSLFHIFKNAPVARCSTNQLGIDAVKDRESHLLNCTRWLNLV